MISKKSGICFFLLKAESRKPAADESYLDMSDRSIRPIDMGDFQGSAQ